MKDILYFVGKSEIIFDARQQFQADKKIIEKQTVENLTCTLKKTKKDIKISAVHSMILFCYVYFGTKLFNLYIF